jgi:hypothetical protein
VWRFAPPQSRRQFSIFSAPGPTPTAYGRRDFHDGHTHAAGRGKKRIAKLEARADLEADWERSNHSKIRNVPCNAELGCDVE